MASKEAWVERILRVLDHIQTHLDDELDPSELAQLAEFSLHHFHRVFRGMTGESVMGLVRRLRLERAALRIKFGHQPITEVAALSGYGSHEAFTRAFRARFELAPVEFRQQRSAVELKNREVSRQTRPQRTLLTVRHTGPYEECMGSWDRLLGWAGPLGLLERSEESLGLCYDDPEITPGAHLRYDAGISVPPGLEKQLALPSDITVRTLKAGNYDGILHLGCYEDIFDSYVALLGHFLPRLGAELVDEPIVEVYLNSPYETSPDELKTLVCVRIED